MQRFRDRPARRAADQRRRPLVYVTFGSEAPASEHFPGVYRDTIAALAELPVPVLVTIGDRRDPAELGPLPPSVRVERWVVAGRGDAAWPRRSSATAARARR